MADAPTQDAPPPAPDSDEAALEALRAKNAALKAAAQDRRRAKMAAKGGKSSSRSVVKEERGASDANRSGHLGSGRVGSGHLGSGWARTVNLVF